MFSAAIVGVFTNNLFLSEVLVSQIDRIPKASPNKNVSQTSQHQWHVGENINMGGGAE
jgi:hypothetical protein